jgi:hypothetical protein
MARQTSSLIHSRLLREHSLSIVVAAIWLLWIGLYLVSDPQTHLGAFFGNSVADWLGMLTIVLITKFFFERGSRESRPVPSRPWPAWLKLLTDHSLTIVLALTGAAWVALYMHSDPNGKAGQVFGNIVSEWGQMVGLVVLTKRLHERGSKEG